MNPRLKVCVALSALALSAMLPAAAERGAEGFLDRAESALREEARSFHEDVTSSNRWREWALHRANGEETDVQGWLSSRWEETPVRLADGYAASLADWAAADLRESDWVETLDFSFQLPIEGRDGRLNVSAIGPLARGLGGGDGVLGWQFPLAVGSAEDGNTELSGNVGLFYRQVLGGSGLAGLNVFGDYQDEGADGSFWRWSLGAEYRTAWADVYANRYFPSAVSHRRLVSGGKAERIAYSAGGYDAEVRVHAPGSDWLEGFAEYSLWEGEHGDGDEEGFRYGFRFSPRTGGVADGFRLEADYDAEEGGLGGRFDYSWTLGEFRRIGGVAAFDPRSHLLSPVERHHAQRVRVRTRDLIVLSAVGRSASGGQADGNFSCGLPDGGWPPNRSTLTYDDKNTLSYQLEEAVRANDYKMVCDKLNIDNADPTLPGIISTVQQDVALHYAASLDALEIVTLLVSRMSLELADLNSDSKLTIRVNPLAFIGRDWETALHRAAEFGSFRVAHYLLEQWLEQDADFNMHGADGRNLLGLHVRYPLDAAVEQGDKRMAKLLRSYGGECKNKSAHAEERRGWCEGIGLTVSLDWIGEATLYAAGGYEGSLPAVSAAESEGRGVTVSYGLSGESADFVFDGTLRVLSTAPEASMESGSLYSVTLWAAGRHAPNKLQPLTLHATVAVSALADASRTVTASPYADYSSGGGLLTLSSLWEDLPEGLTLSYEKAAGSSKELTLAAGDAGGFLSWSGEEGVSAALGARYEMSAHASAPWLAGSLLFSAEVEAGCAAGGEYGEVLPGDGVHDDIFSAAGSSKLNDACWLIGEKGLTVVDSRYLPGAGDNVAAYKPDATPLHWAVKGDGNADDRKKMIDLLLYYGADLSARNRDGAAPLDLAESVDDAKSLRTAGGVCYVRADERCGLRFLPGPAGSFSVTVADGFSGELWAVTVGIAAESSEVSYRLFSEDSRLTASGLLGADQVLRVSSEARLVKGESLSASVALWAGLQTLSASLAVVVLEEEDFMLSAHRSEVTAAAEYAGVLATLSATEEGVTVFYRSGLDAGFTLAALPSGQAALSLISSLGAEGAVVTAEVELGKHGYFRTTVTALVTVSALLPTEGVFTILSNNGDTGVRLSAMHEGTRYEKIGGSAGLSVSDSGEIFVTEPGLSNFVWHHLKARADSPGILGGERFSVSLLAAPCAPGDPPAGDLNLIAAVNNRGIDSDGVCRMILADANVNVKNSNKATPLHRAVVREDYAIASLLIDAGAEVDAQNTKGKTPLYLAASLPRAGMVSLLLSAGADGGLADEKGITPLDMAVENDLDVVADIRDAGGVCLTRTDAACGLVMRPLHSTVVVAQNHVGAALAVTATTHGDAAPVYSLVDEVAGFSFDSGTLTADSGTLAEGLVATVSIQATTEGGAQTVAVERVVSVSAPTLAGVLSDYPSRLTAAAGYTGALATLSATEEGVTVFYRSGLDAERFALATLSSGKAELSLISRLGGGGTLAATAVLELGKYGHVSVMVTALVTVAALGPFEAVKKEMEASASGAVYRFSLPGYENASFSAAEGSAAEFDVSSDGEVSRKEDVEVDAVYEVVVLAKDEGFLGAVSLTLSVHSKGRVRAEFSAARYRAALAGGYEGAVLTLSAADERVSLAYLEDEEDGLNGSSFSLVSLSSGITPCL